MRRYAWQLETDNDIRAQLAGCGTSDECSRFKALFDAVLIAHPDGGNQQQPLPTKDKRTQTRNSYAAALHDLYAAQHAVATKTYYPINVTDAIAAVTKYAALYVPRLICVCLIALLLREICDA
jgi:hypothetical protein